MVTIMSASPTLRRRIPFSVVQIRPGGRQPEEWSAIGDIDGDGRNEILLSEGDPLVYGRSESGRLAWFESGRPLYDAHTLQTGDLCGNGRVDIVCGEVGEADPSTDQYVGHAPRSMVFENDGSGGFRHHIIDEGTGSHDGWLVDTRKAGKLDLVTKPLPGRQKRRIRVYYNAGAYLR